MRLFINFFYQKFRQLLMGDFFDSPRKIFFYASEWNFGVRKMQIFFREYCGNSDTGKYRAF